MLASKFIVQSNLANIARPVYRIRQVGKKSLRNQDRPGSEINKDSTNVSKCEKGSEKQLSRIGQSIEHYKRLLLGQKPKAVPKPVDTDSLSEATRVVNKRAKDLSQSIHDQLEATQRQIEKEVKQAKDTESTRFRELCKLTECKLQILMTLDKDCGMEKRRIVLSFNDQVRQAFEKLQSDLTPSIEQTSLTLNQVQRETFAHIKRTTEIIPLCRSYTDPNEVKACTDKKKDLALKMLAKTKDDVQLTVEGIKKRYAKIMDIHKRIADEVAKTYLTQATELAKDLDSNITKIKRRCQ